jgi:hypothetical protein
MKGIHIILEGQHGYPGVFGPFESVTFAIAAAFAYFKARDADIREGWETTIEVHDENGPVPQVTSDADGYEATAWIIRDWEPSKPEEFHWVKDDPA